MSVGKKIVDGAKAGIESLLEKISAGGTPLPGVGSVELERELAARRALRLRRNDGKPEENVYARDAAGGAEAARRRASAAAARTKSAGAARARQREASAAAAERAAREAAAADAAAREASFRKFREDVKSGRRREPPPGGPDPFAGGGGARGGGFGFAPRSNEKIAKAYKTLDLADGAPFAEVKAQYRKLMRKYHPDMHTGNPQKQKAATELSMQVTQAYNQLDEHLNRKK